MMEQEDLKRKLMGLWEKTTHSSKEVLSILFEYYFDIKYLEYTEIEGKILSAVCGIPYTFGYGANCMKGLFLISLSSEEGFRKKGNLSELLTRINGRLADEFDFTFIVPPTALLADYYGTQGYFSSFFIIEERFTPLHDFKNDYFLSLNDSNDRERSLRLSLFDEINVIENKEETLFSKEQIVNFIEDIEKKPSSSLNLSHSVKDLDYILREGLMRNLNSYIAYDSDGRISGVMFCQKEELKRIRVVASYMADICSYYALLNFIKNTLPEYSLSINTSEPKFQTISLIQQTYASANPNGGDLDNTLSVVEIPFNINKLLQPKGMVRILRFDKVLEYIAKTRRDVEFKLHIRDFIAGDNNNWDGEPLEEIENDYSAFTEDEIIEVDKPVSLVQEIVNDKEIFIVKDGKFSIQPYSSYHNDRSVLSLTTKEVSELLLRKNDSSNLIMEAFGIPRLNLQYLLLPF